MDITFVSKSVLPFVRKKTANGKEACQDQSLKRLSCVSKESIEYPPVHTTLLNSVLQFFTCDKNFDFLTRILFLDKIMFQCFHSLRFKITRLKFRRTRTTSKYYNS